MGLAGAPGNIRGIGMPAIDVGNGGRLVGSPERNGGHDIPAGGAADAEELGAAVPDGAAEEAPCCVLLPGWAADGLVRAFNGSVEYWSGTAA